MIPATAMLILSAAACNKIDEPATPPQEVSFTLTFDGTISPSTRVSFNDNALTGEWEEDDIVYVYMKSTDGNFNGPYEAKPKAPGPSASFYAEITGLSTGTKISAIYAYNYHNLTGPSYNVGDNTYSITMPTVYDGKLSYVTVASHKFDNGTEPEVNNGRAIDVLDVLTFEQTLARIDITTDLQVKEITLKLIDAEFPTAKEFNVSNYTTAITASSSILRIKPNSEENKQYFHVGVIPFDLGGNKALKATLITTDGEVYERNVTTTTTKLEKAKRYTLSLNTTDLTKTDAIAISDEDGLKAMNQSDKHFILTDDIKLTKVPQISNFGGILDGNDHTLDLSGIASSTESGHGGIFANTNGNAVINDLTVIGGDRLATSDEDGIIVGKVTDSSTLTIDNVHVSGSITYAPHSSEKHFLGGILGFAPSSSKVTISNSSFTGTVSINQEGTTSQSFSSAFVGGIVGCLDTNKPSLYSRSASSIDNCTVTDIHLNNTNHGQHTAPEGDTSGSEIYTGGIAGRCIGPITNCHVENAVIESIVDEDGSSRMAKPILGNDWNANPNNSDNTYKNVKINGKEFTE